MKTIGINSDLVFSLFLHALIIAITLIVARHSNISKAPVPYIVTIVDSPTAPTSTASLENKSAGSETIVTSKPIVKPADSPKSKSAPKKQDEGIIKERIAALEAKKKIEKMVALRKIVDIGKIRGQQSAVSSQGAKTPSSISKIQGPAGGDYYSMVVNRIKEQWIYPESVDKELLAVVIIRIAKDGNITIDKIEKSSGNPLFDRSALRAINKSSPLPPPPEEIEIGVRFYP